jgi:alpha-L-arabinofuranosidase
MPASESTLHVRRRFCQAPADRRAGRPCPVDCQWLVPPSFCSGGIVVMRHALFALAVVFVACQSPLLRAQDEQDGLTATAVIQGDEAGGRISRHIYGHFAEHLGRCIYDGLWVGEDSSVPNTRGIRNDVIEALKATNIPNLRWPGGCFADDYHWRDGIGPRDERPKTLNIHWGQVVETNTFGTHEFLDLCELIGADAYIAGNMGSGSPEEMRDWIEYMTYDGDSDLANLRRKNGRDKPWKVPFFGVGNENWGCGGNMRPEYYSDLYRQYATFCREFSGNRLTRVACGPGGLNREWTRVVMDRIGNRMQALSVHFYTVTPSWQNKSDATGFDEANWFAVLRECLNIEQAINESAEEMDRVDPRKRIGMFVDEWGSWYDVEEGHPGSGLYQQNSIRDALLAGLTFHIFHEHSDRVKMANIAQTVNVLQSLFLTEDEKLVLTPTYHVFEMYKVHHDATRLPVELESPEYKLEDGDEEMPAVSVSASRDGQGVVHVSLVNAHARAGVAVSCELRDVEATGVTGRILTAEELDAHNTFEAPENVKPAPFDGAEIAEGKLSVKLPPRSVVVLTLE